MQIPVHMQIYMQITYLYDKYDATRNIVQFDNVTGDAADTRVFWYTQPRAKSIFTDGLRVPAGYTESVLVTFPQW